MKKVYCPTCDKSHGVFWHSPKRPKPHKWTTEIDGEYVDFWSGDRDVMVRCPKGSYGTSIPLTPYPGVPRPRSSYGHFGPRRPKVYPDEWCNTCMDQDSFPGHCGHGPPEPDQLGAPPSCCNCDRTRDWILDEVPVS